LDYCTLEPPDKYCTKTQLSKLASTAFVLASAVSLPLLLWTFFWNFGSNFPQKEYSSLLIRKMKWVSKPIFLGLWTESGWAIQYFLYLDLPCSLANHSYRILKSILYCMKSKLLINRKWRNFAFSQFSLFWARVHRWHWEIRICLRSMWKTKMLRRALG
jgi:hypothetical protein